MYLKCWKYHWIWIISAFGDLFGSIRASLKLPQPDCLKPQPYTVFFFHNSKGITRVVPVKNNLNLTSKFSKNSINFSLFLKSVRATPNGFVGLATFWGINFGSNGWDHVIYHVTMWDHLWDNKLHGGTLKLRNSSSEAKDYSRKRFLDQTYNFRSHMDHVAKLSY